MDIHQLKALTEKDLPPARYEHTLRVEEIAVNLAEKLGIDKEKTSIAAILHDFCKFWPKETLKSWIHDRQLPLDLLEFHSELWHGPVGAEVAAIRFGITDQEILQAIRYHTTGRPEMSMLEKVIFLADIIEPGRQFPGVEELRKIAKHDLDRAVLESLDQTIRFLLKKRQKIYPLTFLARNYFLDIVSKKD